MSPETDALAPQRTALQPRPTPHPGPLTVSAYQIGIREGLASNNHLIGARPHVAEINAATPLQADANRSRVFGQLPMQFDAPNSQAFSRRELSRCEVFAVGSPIGKMNPGKSIATTELDSEPKELPLGIRHQSFAACLVNWWDQGVGNYHVQAALPQSNAGRQTCGTTSDNKDVTSLGPSGKKMRIPLNGRYHSAGSPTISIAGLTPLATARKASARPFTFFMNETSRASDPLPLQQRHLRAKTRPHGRQNTLGPWSRAAVLHHFIQHHQH